MFCEMVVFRNPKESWWCNKAFHEKFFTYKLDSICRHTILISVLIHVHDCTHTSGIYRIQKQYNLLEHELKWNNAVVVKKNSNVVFINYKCRRFWSPTLFHFTFTYRMYDLFVDKQNLYYTTFINMYQWREWEMDCRTRECLTSIFLVWVTTPGLGRLLSPL